MTREGTLMVSFDALARPRSRRSATRGCRAACGCTTRSKDRRTGPAVLMLHGYTDSWFSFSRVLPLMPADLRIIVPDQRGHGSSATSLRQGTAVNLSRVTGWTISRRMRSS